MSDSKYSVLFMRDDRDVSRYRLSPFWLKMFIFSQIFLFLFAVGGIFMGVRGFKINADLQSENKNLEQRLVDAEVRLERLGNMEKILESYDPVELQSLLSAATSPETEEPEPQVEINLNEIFVRADTQQVGVENLQAKLSQRKLSVSFELNNLQAAKPMAGQADFVFVKKDGSSMPAKTNKNDLGFQIQRFKRIQTTFLLPEGVDKDDLFGLRLEIKGRTVMSFLPKRILCTTFSLSLIVMLFASSALAGSWEHSFFAGTQYPLKVFFLQGEEDGPTIMVQGGIQGDETSGFVTAQLLSQSKVKRGNLIVLPRANVPSINLHKRQINVDMNRRFDQDYNRFYEDRVARVIRFLLAQSEAFIHLHEGSGFYNPTYVNNLRNPKRYGQSIIVDTLIFDKIDLAHTVNSVLSELNGTIPASDYQFKLFNTKTFDKGTPYPEMRKSLTCYALAEHGIPAMAVEVSKSIRQIDWKVRQQLAATIMLLERFGVSVTPPDFSDEDVRAYARRGVTVNINGRPLRSGKVINLAPGATLAVETLGRGPSEFSPELALFASDRPGVNLINARRMVLEPFTELELRSDGKRVAKTQIKWTGKLPLSPGEDKPVFVCWLNGNPVFVRDGEVLKTVLGDQLILEGLWGSDLKEIVNLKGFVAIPWANNGQDLGWEIILDPDNFIDRYTVSSDRPGVMRFRVVRETPAHPKQGSTWTLLLERFSRLNWRTSGGRLLSSRGPPVEITDCLKGSMCLRRRGAMVPVTS